MSWRKYGGINKLDQRNNITVNTIVADKFTVRQAFLSEFNITGDFNIFGNAIISQILQVRQKLQAETIDVSGNTVLGGKIYLSKQANPAYLIGGNNYTFGVNKINPTATIDISSNQPQTINVKTSDAINRNILARNTNDRGIALYTSGITESSIQFYSDTSVTTATTTPDAKVSYTGGNMILDTNGDIKLLSTAVITNRAGNAHISNETLTIYDTLSGTYRFPVYNDTTSQVGNALTLVAQNNNSNTQMNIMTPDKHGMRLIGGVYPKDKSRGMAVIDVSNSTPSQMIVTGNSLTKYHSTIGINTYTPKVDQYVVDINGPVHVNNGEVTKIATVPFEVKSMSGFLDGLTGIAIGTPYTTTKFYSVYRTSDGGQTWSNLNLTGDMNSTNDIFTCSSVLDSNRYIIAGRNSFMFFTNDGGVNWNRILLGDGITRNFTSVHIISATKVVAGHDNGFVVFTMNFEGSASYTSTGVTDVTIPLNTKTGTDSDGVNVWIVYNNYIRKTPINVPGTHIYNIQISEIGSGKYNAIDVYNSTHAVAVGTNMISYTVNDGTNWVHVPVPGVTFNDVYVHDEMRAIAVGDAGAIYITSDGYKTWEPISDNLINSAGYSIDRSLNISSVYAQNASTLMISSIKTAYTYNLSGVPTVMGSTYLYHTFVPYLFDRENTSVMDLCGNMKLSGDLQVNNDGKIRSNNLTFDLLKDTVTAINMGLASTTTTIGSTSGNTFVRNKLRVTDDIIGSAKLQITSDASLNAKLFAAGDVSFNQKLTVGGNVIMKGSLIVDGKVSFTGDIFQTDINHNIQTSQQIDISNLITGTALTVRQYGTDGLSSIAKLFNGDELVVDFKHGGDVSLNQNLYVSKTTDLHGVATVSNTTESTTQSNGALIVNGGVGIIKNLNIGGLTRVRNLTDSTNVSTGALIVDGGVGIGNKLTVGDNTTIEGTLLVKENVTFDDLTESFGPSTGALIVKGGVGIGQKVNIAGTTNISNSTASTSIASGALHVTGGAGIGGNTYVGGIVFATNSINSSDTSTGALVVSGGVGIANATNIGGQTKITDATISSGTASGALQVTGGVGVGGAIFAGGAILTKATTASTDTSTGALIVSGGAGIAGATNIGGQTKIMDSTTSTGIASGALQVTGGVGIGGNTQVGGIVFARSSTNSIDVSTGSLIVSGGVGIASSTNIGGITNISDSTTSISTASGALQVTGGAGIGGNTYVGGIVFATATTASGNVSTGALVVSGGVGIKGGMVVGETIYATSTTNSSNISTGALVVSGGVGIDGQTYISGQIFAKSLTNSDDTSTGSLVVSGGAGIQKNVTIGGVTKITDATLTTDKNTGALVVAGGIGVGGDVYIGGTTESVSNVTGALVVSGGLGITGNTYIKGTTFVMGNLILSGNTYTSNRTTNGNSEDTTPDNITQVYSGGAYEIAGGMTLQKTLYTGLGVVSDGLIIARNTTVSTSTATGALKVAGGAGIGGNVFIGGNSVVSGTIAASGTFTTTNITNSTSASTGALQVTGGAGIGGNVYVGGNVFAVATTASTGTNSGALQVSGGAGIGGNVFIGGNTSLTGRLAVTGDTTATSITTSGILKVSDSTTSEGTTSGALQVTGGAGIGGNVFIGGNTSLTGRLAVTGATTTTSVTTSGILKVSDSTTSEGTNSGALQVTGGAGIGGNVFIGGNTSLTGRLAVTGDSTMTTMTTSGILKVSDSTTSEGTNSGALQVMGGAGIGGNMFIGGNTALTGRLSVTGATTTTSITTSGILKVSDSTTSEGTTSGALQVTGGVGIGGNVFIGGNTSLTGRLAVTGATTVTAITTSGILKVSDSTTSEGTSSGALQVTGGAGIGGNVFIGGNTALTGRLAVTGATTATTITTSGILKVSDSTTSEGTNTGAVQVTGGAGIGGNINVGGAAYINSAINSTSKTTGGLVVTGGAGIGGNLFVGGNAKITGSLTVDGSLNIMNGVISTTVTETVLISERVNITNTGTGPGLVVRQNGDEAIAEFYDDANLIMVIKDLGDVSMNKTLAVGGITSIKNNTKSTSTSIGALQVTGGVGIVGNTYVGGSIFAVSTTESTSADTGALIVTGGAGIGGNTYVGGNVFIRSAAISGNVSSGALVVGGGVGIVGNAFIGGNTIIGGNIFVSGNTTFASNTISGSAIIAGSIPAGKFQSGIIAGGDLATNININTSGNLISSSDWASTSTGTGALRVTGGAGIGGNVYIGAATVSGNAFSGALVVSGGAGIAGSTYVGGTIFAAANTLSTSNTTGALVVTGGAGIGGNVYVGDNIYHKNILVQTKRAFAINLIGQGDTNFFAIEIQAPTDLTSGTGLPIEFTITGQSLATSNVYNDVTLHGYVRTPGGTTDHPLMYDFTQVNFNAAEQRFLDIYYSTSAEYKHIVIYARGGYQYTVITNGANAAYPGGTSFFAGSSLISSSKSEGGGDVAPGTTTAIILSVSGKRLLDYPNLRQTNVASLNNSTAASTSTLTGALLVSGGAGIGGNVSVGGNIFLNTGNSVYVNGTLLSGLSADSVQTSYIQNSAVTGPKIASGAIDATKLSPSIDINTTGGLTTTLNTASTSTGTGALRVTGGAGIGGNIFIGGNAFIVGNTIVSGNLFVSGNTTFANNTISGAAIIPASIVAGKFASGALASDLAAVTINTSGGLTTTLNTASTSTGTGALRVTGGAGIGGNVSVGGNIFLNTGNSIYVNGVLLTTGGTSGNVVATSSTASTSTTTGALQVAGGAGIRGNAYVGGTIFAAATTPSTSDATGALVVTGGAGISGNVNVGITNNVLTVGVTSTSGIITSVDGINWTSRISGLTGSGADSRSKAVWGGSNWVACSGASSTTHTIATSPDGITWTGRGNSVVTKCEGLAWNGTFWLAVGTITGGNGIARSDDGGATWTAVANTNLTTGDERYSITWNSKQSLWVASRRNNATLSTSAVVYSSDGITWTPVATSTNGLFFIENNGDMFIGTYNASAGFYSYDGITWYPMTIGTAPSDVKWNGSLWMAVGSTSIYTSSNGITWTAKTSPGATIYSIGWNGTYWIAGATSALYYSSNDGASWTLTSSGGVQTYGLGSRITQTNGTPSTSTTTGALVVNGGAGIRGNTYIGATGELPIIQYGLTVGVLNSTIRTSVDGITWNSVTGVTVGGALGSTTAAWGGSNWVVCGGAVSQTNTIATSPDGINWTGRGNAIVTLCNDVAWNGTFWLAAGIISGGARIARSNDGGATWTAVANTNLAVTSQASSVTWNSKQSLWLVSGTGTSSGSTIVRSSDGITWSTATTATTGFQNVFNNGTMFIGTNGATSMYSTDGISWTSMTIIGSGTINDMKWNGSLWMAGTNTSPYTYISTDGITWTGTTAPPGTQAESIGWNGSYWIAGTNASSYYSSNNGKSWTVISGVVGRMLGIGTQTTVIDPTGALVVRGGTSIRGNVNVGANTASTSATTGALIVSGGAGISGNVNVRGTIFASGRFKTQLIAANSTPSTLTSSDSMNWSSVTGFGVGGQPVNSMAWGGSNWVAGLNNGNIYTSPDGVTWTLRISNLTVCAEVAWNGSYWLAAGTAAGVQAIVRSTDGGNTWSSPIANILLGNGDTVVHGLVWNSVASIWVAGSYTGTGSSIVSSLDSVTWTSLSTTVSMAGKLRSNGNVYIVLMNGPFIQRSTDAITWSAPATDGTPKDVAWNGSIWMLVTGNQSSYTSTDGGQTAWVRTAGTLPACNSIVWDSTNLRWVAAGTSGGIYWSADDGASWNLGSGSITGARLGFSNVIPDNSSINTSTGALVVSGGAGIGGNVSVGGNIFLNTGNSIYVDGVLLTTGGTSGNVVATSTTASTSTSTGALVVSGGAGIVGDVNVGGIIETFSSTASTSTASGALQVIGGAGIGGNVYVGGNIIMTNTNNNSTRFGHQALNVGTGSNNTAFGKSAGSIITNGTDNTCLGFNANTNGNNSFATIIGSNAENNDSGVSVGYYAGSSISTALRNIAIGNEAIGTTTNPKNLTAGSDDNLCIGLNAGRLLNGATAARNVAIGNNSLGGDLATTNTTTGQDNFCLGTNAGKNITSGSYNVGIGTGSLGGNSSESGGNSNVCIGQNAGGSLNGNENVLIGQGAGVSITNGSSNTCIGRGSVVLGSDNVAIGWGSNSGSGDRNSCIGTNSVVNGLIYDSVAIGAGATVSTSNTIVLGTASESVIIVGTNVSTSASTGALVVGGGAGIGGNVFIGSDMVAVNGNTSAGALVVRGGAGISGNVSIGGNMFLNTGNGVYVNGELLSTGGGGGGGSGQTTYIVDYTGYTTATNFYAIEIQSPAQIATGIYPPIEFQITSDNGLIGTPQAAPYADVTLIGTVRPQGSSPDHELYYDLTQVGNEDGDSKFFAVCSGSTPASTSFSGTISTTTLTVSTLNSGIISIGQCLFGQGIATGTTIVSQLSGTTGGTGTYLISLTNTVASSTAMITVSPAASFTGTIATNTLTVTSVNSGIIAVGQPLIGVGITAGTRISSLIPTTGGTGGIGTYNINQSNTVATAISMTTIPASSTFTGSITGTTLTVTVAPTTGIIAIGQPLFGVGVAFGTIIISGTGLTGTGGSGTYAVNISQPVTSTSTMITSSATKTYIGYINAGILTISAIISGAPAIGDYLYGTGVLPGTQITGNSGGVAGTNGSSYTINLSQTVSSTTLTSSAVTGSLIVYARGASKYYITTNGTVNTNGTSNYTTVSPNIGTFPGAILSNGATAFGFTGTFTDPANTIIATNNLSNALNRRLTNLGASFGGAISSTSTGGPGYNMIGNGSGGLYMTLFPDGPGTRRGYIGYPTTGNTELDIVNEYPSGNISIDCPGAVFIGSASSNGLKINSTTASVSTASGALQVMGGAGFGKEICAPSYNAISDSRIKNNIIDISGQSSLDLFRDLKPSEYKLIANPEKPKTYGFIAQEIMRTIPEAVTLGTDFVPSVYEMAFVDYGKTTVTLINKRTDESWKKIRISEDPYDVTEVIDDKTFHVKTEIPNEKIELVDVSGTKLTLKQGVYRYKDTDVVYNGLVKNGVFVYGHEVPDFHSLNKDMIWTVTTRATQELDKQLQDARQRISVLENQVSELTDLVKTLINNQ